MTSLRRDPIVTDHAVLRYIERKHGVEVERIRDHIAELVRRGVEKQGDAVISEGVKFVLRGNRVVTVGARQWAFPKSEHDDG